jgi:hypothetical protein
MDFVPPVRPGHESTYTPVQKSGTTSEDAVMASEIEQLPDISGYLKLASCPQWS